MADETELDHYSAKTDDDLAVILEDSDKPQSTGFNKVSQIWRNLFVLETAVLILCGASLALEQLQSSLFTKEGMGTTVFAIINSCQVISALFLGTPLMVILGAKWTIVISLIGYNIYKVSYFYASWELFIPTGIIRGLSVTIFVARGYYLNVIAHDYARLKDISNDAATSLIIGISEGFYKSSAVWGNLATSQILSPNDVSLAANWSSALDLSLCGNRYCPENAVNIPYLQGPSKKQLYLLAGTFTGCASLAVVLVFALQQLPSERKKRILCTKEAWKPKNLLATFILLKNRRILLLIPLSILTGMMRATFFADYSEAFITCPLGSWWVGYVAICYSVIDGVSSVVLGRLVKYVGRIPIFALGFVSNAAALLPLLFYEVATDKLYIYFILSGIWGIADAALSVQLTALYGVLFKEDGKAAFGIYRLWRSMGYIISFAIQSHLCISTKMYLLLFVLTLGVIGYIIVEVMERRKGRAEQID